MGRNVLRGLALLLLLVPMLLVGFWHTRIDAPVDGEIGGFTAWLRDHGLGFLDYATIEFTANIVWFVPFAFVAVLLLGRRWWGAVVAGTLVVSAAIEVGQALFVPERVATIWDVVANALGGALGALVGVLVDRRIRRPPAAG